MKKNYGIFLLVLMLSMFFLNGVNLERTEGLGLRVAYAEDEWKTDFDDICSRTQDAMSFDKEELTVLVERCDKLKPRIEKLGDTERRFYLKRLKMCRDLFSYALEVKKGK